MRARATICAFLLAACAGGGESTGAPDAATDVPSEIGADAASKDAARQDHPKDAAEAGHTTCPAPKAARATIATPASDPGAIAVVASHVYYVVEGADAGLNGADIWRVPLAGGTAEKVVTGDALSSQGSLAGDSKYLYYLRSAGNGHTAVAWPLAGGAATRIVAPSPYAVFTSVLTHGDGGPYFYMHDTASPSIQHWDSQTRVLSTVQSGLSTAADTAFFVDTRSLYWHKTPSDTMDAIVRSPLSGGSPRVVTALNDSSGSPMLLGLGTSDVIVALDVLNGGAMVRVPKGGGEQVVIVDSASPSYASYVDDSDVYWADSQANAPLRRASITGGKAATVDNDRSHNVIAIAGDACSLAWATDAPAILTIGK